MLRPASDRTEDLRLVAEILGLRAALPVALRTLPMDACLRWLTPRHEPPPPAHPTEVLRRVDHWTELLLRRNRFHRGACLVRSLTRYRMLRVRGLPARFRMGVRERQGTFEGHAWIELNGAPIMEHEALTFAVTFEFPLP